MAKWLRPGEQPRLQEMLDDPVVRVVMCRDGVAREEVEALVHSLAARTDWSGAHMSGSSTKTACDEADLLAGSLGAARQQLSQLEATNASD